MVTKRDWALGGEHPLQDTDDGSWNCAPETYVVLVTAVTPMQSTTSFDNIA